MIKLEHVVLPSPEQMEFVIEGMRNPMNSWDKSDSYNYWGPSNDGRYGVHGFEIGDNDLSLMQKLSAGGPDDRKFMRMMPVMVRITAPLYWWKEFDTYKVGTVANSCSTMHKIHAKEFTMEDFSFEKVRDKGSVWRCNTIYYTIEALNYARDMYLETKDKTYWYEMIQLLPSSYNQTRNVMLNYEVLKNMYHARKGHKLDEWREFCKWVETLPYSELITGGKHSEEIMRGSCSECKQIDTCKDKIDARNVDDDIKYGIIVPNYIPGLNAECLAEGGKSYESKSDM